MIAADILSLGGWQASGQQSRPSPALLFLSFSHLTTKIKLDQYGHNLKVFLLLYVGPLIMLALM